jgi:ribonuclease R
MSPRKSPDTPAFNDPHAEREAATYENPIPSRELILEVLQQHGKPMSAPQLAGHFGLHEPEREEALRRRLGAMVRDGQADCNRRGAYAPLTDADLIRGRVQGHPDGFGFLIPTDGSPDLLLTSKQMRLVFNGDVVSARVAGFDHKGRREGQIVRVEERNTKSLVGRYLEENGSAFVLPDNVRVTQEVLVEGDTKGAEVGQFVSVEITNYPTHRGLATGRIVEVLGDYMAPGMEIDIAIRNYGIPHSWPAEVEAEVAGLSAEVAEKDKVGRTDLRNLPLCTIDGEDARDFDDAVFAERKKSGGYRLIVAIADVSHYVQPGTALDVEAKARGTSVYFPDFVVPMLPEILSNGLCSLNPHVDRLCMVCDMTISAAGKVTTHKFYDAVMHSKARLTYTKVSALIEHPDSVLGKQVAADHPAVLDSVHTLYELFQLLRKVREERGALDFDSQETRIIFGENRKIEKIIPVTRNKAHMLIEEMMLAANVCAAAYMLKHQMPTLYRNHEGPRDEKLNKLKSFLGALGITFTASKKPLPSDFQAILAKISTRPDAHIIQTMLLRSLSQAVYAPDNLGHFGLAYKAYAHFTSPIRRYPDLLLHRGIRAVLKGQAAADGASAATKINRAVRSLLGKPVPVAEGDSPVQMVALGEHCSMVERRADEATRDVTAWLKCEYMQDRVGEDFDGVIAGVTSFGFFVELKDIYVEGLVHISRLRDDYYIFDQVMNRLVGERTGLSFSLGDTVKVRVAGVNLDERKIDFEPLSEGSRRKGGGGGKREQLASGELLKQAGPGKGRSGDGRGGRGGAKSGGKAPAKAGGKAGDKAEAPRAGGKKPASRTRKPR